MSTATIPTDMIPALGHDEAMDLAAIEYDRVLKLADSLTDADWSSPTDCPDWDVRAMLGHMLGMLELQAGGEERMRQIKAAAALAERSGEIRLHEMTALQVRERAHLSHPELLRALHQAAPRGLAARRAMSDEERAITYDSQLRGEDPWTFAYLYDTIHTRDPWMHRIDITRAIGREMEISAGHDGRIVADVVAEWARRHGRPFQLTLTGMAGGSYEAGSGGAPITLDAIDFCRILAGRGTGDGLLSTLVPF
jgi:uncharacterized protein (TIGR03083 family)